MEFVRYENRIRGLKISIKWRNNNCSSHLPAINKNLLLNVSIDYWAFVRAFQCNVKLLRMIQVRQISWFLKSFPYNVTFLRMLDAVFDVMLRDIEHLPNIVTFLSILHNYMYLPSASVPPDVPCYSRSCLCSIKCYTTTLVSYKISCNKIFF